MKSSRDFVAYEASFLACTHDPGQPVFEISLEDLRDKIKGGWAGQTIGCTFGGPTEFENTTERRNHLQQPAITSKILKGRRTT
jgi:hypothetical protein